MTGLHYLATPYSDYPGGLDVAARDAARVAALLTARRMKVFSPIVHSHPLCAGGDLDPLAHDFWLEIDEAFMARCDALIVVKMRGWTESRGVAREIAFFDAIAKPLRSLAVTYASDRIGAEILAAGSVAG